MYIGSKELPICVVVILIDLKLDSDECDICTCLVATIRYELQFKCILNRG